MKTTFLKCLFDNMIFFFVFISCSTMILWNKVRLEINEE